MDTSLLIKGGTDAPSEYVDKTAISSIDGAPTDQSPDENPYFLGYFDNDATRKRSINKIDNVRFGNEICLDHGRRYLKDTAISYKKAHGTDPGIGIHILTSCGMQLQPRSLAAKVNGYVLRVDGIPNAPNNGWQFRSQIQRITSNNFDDNTRDATVLDLTSAPGSSVHAIPLAFQTAYPAPYSALYPQQIKIYATQPF